MVIASDFQAHARSQHEYQCMTHAEDTSHVELDYNQGSVGCLGMFTMLEFINAMYFHIRHVLIATAHECNTHSSLTLPLCTNESHILCIHDRRVVADCTDRMCMYDQGSGCGLCLLQLLAAFLAELPVLVDVRVHCTILDVVSEVRPSMDRLGGRW
jgi:hypothetical protein